MRPGEEGACTQSITHDRNLKTIDPRIPVGYGRSAGARARGGGRGFSLVIHGRGRVNSDPRIMTACTEKIGISPTKGESEEFSSKQRAVEDGLERNGKVRERTREKKNWER